jgi:peptidoglycan hydrolase CwlO-like protein
MAHQQQIDFCNSVKKLLPQFFSGRFVLDIGSLDINGNNQYLFDDCLYLGVDLLPGRNVDMTSKGHELNLPDESLDIIISTECFEHDQFYSLTLKNIVRMLKPGGLFLFTCATTNRPEHGTRRTLPEDAPFIQEFGEWADYYKNLDEADIRQVLNPDVIFDKYAFSTNQESCDLYFWGIKKGVLVNRYDYSFQLRQSELRSTLNSREAFIVELLRTISERDGQVGVLNQSLAERDGQIGVLNQALAERDGQITAFNQALAERDGQITAFNQALAERDGQITAFNQALAERDGQITAFNQALAERDGQITAFNQALAERDGQITAFNQALAERDGQITAFNQALAERDGQITAFNQALAERDGQITAFNQALAERDGQITAFNQALAERDGQITAFNQALAEREVAIAQLHASTSWKFTKPLRFFSRILRGDFKTAFAFLTREHEQKPLSIAKYQDTENADIQPDVTRPLNPTHWGVLATKHTLFVAHLVVDGFKKHGWTAEIMTECPEDFSHDYYLVIYPQMFTKLPPGEKRIVFQIEQSVNSQPFTDSYIETLKSSLAVLEYALVNIEFMEKNGVAYPHVYYLPVGASINYFNLPNAFEKKYDIVLYSDSCSSLRRQICSMP